MLLPYYFYWFRIDNKHMTEPWLDQALMDSAYRSDIIEVTNNIFKENILFLNSYAVFSWISKKRCITYY